MAMKNPVHPGAIVREDCMKPLNLSVTECAKMLGVARQTLSNLVNRYLFPLKWPTGCQRRLVRLQEPGLVCNWPLILPNRRIWSKKSR